MTAARIFRTATPTRDHAPIMGIDSEFMSFLEARKRPSVAITDPHTGAVIKAPAHIYGGSK